MHNFIDILVHLQNILFKIFDFAIIKLFSCFQRTMILYIKITFFRF